VFAQRPHQCLGHRLGALLHPHTDEEAHHDRDDDTEHDWTIVALVLGT